MAYSAASFRARAAMGGVALSALLLATGGTAHAAASSGGGTVLGEVVVTAQKRSENLQKTPIAVTALTSSKIEQGNLAQPVQLQFNVPSMTFGNSDGYSYLTLRGVGNDVTTTAAESSVATYLDGVYTGQTIAESIPTYDLQRIEILRGPQGTLYGRNTTGGVINYITKPPSFEPGANAAVSYGNYNAVQTDVGVTGALVPDKVAGRLSFHFGEHDGYRFNIARNERDYADRNISGRGAVLFKPTEHLTVTLRGDMAVDRSNDAFALIQSTPLDGVTSQSAPLGIFSLPAAALTGLLSPSDLTKLNGGSIATYYGLQQPGPLAPNPLKSWDVANGAPTNFRAESDGGSITVDWDAGPAQVKSISAYRYARLYFENDSGGISTPSVDFSPLNQSNRQFTQEFDVSGKAFDGKLDWLVGAFYFHDDGDFNTTVWLPGQGDFYNAYLNLSSTSGPYPFNLDPTSLVNFTNFVAPNILSTVVANGRNYTGGGNVSAYSTIPSTAFLGFAVTQKSESIAGFMQATYHVTDSLRVSGGFRYTSDTKSVVRSLHSNLVYTLDTIFSRDPNLDLCDHVSSKRSWTAPTGMIGLDYDVAPHVLTYAKASWGYKAGGMNPGECRHIFNPEYLTDYEGGIKAVFADGQILTNAAIYYYDYTNIQFTSYINNASSILNAGSAKAFGAEIEYAIVPRALHGLQLDGSASFEDSHYGNGCFNDPANLAGTIPLTPDGSPPKLCPAGVAAYAQIKGNELVRAPRWKMNVGLQYTMLVPGGGDLLIRGEAAWTDTIYNDIFNGKARYESSVTQPAYWMLNARLVWTSADNRYTAELFGANLTNSNYATNRVGFNTPTSVDNVAGQFAPPRTFGVRLAMKFGSAAR